MNANMSNDGPVCDSCGGTTWNYVQLVQEWDTYSTGFDLEEGRFWTVEIKEEDIDEIIRSYFECEECGNEASFDDLEQV